MIKIFNALLILTNRCNLRCVYCYEGQAGNDYAGTDIDKETIEKSLRFLLDHTIKSRVPLNTRTFDTETLSIYLWGGEPTMRPDLMEFAFEQGNKMASEAGKRIKWRVSTNGVLVDERIAKMIEGCEIFLSVDDCGISQMKTRGHDTDYLKSSVWQRLINKADIMTCIVNHPKYASGRLLDQVKSLMDLGLTKFYPSMALGIGWPVEEFEKYEKTYYELTKWHMEGKIKLPNFDEYMEEEDLTDTVLWTGDKTAVCITTDGDVYPSDLDAYMKYSKIGNVKDGVDEIQLESIVKERSILADKTKACRNCIALRECASYGPIQDFINKKQPIPVYYIECCREILARVRSWYRIKYGEEPKKSDADYESLANVNRQV